MRLAQWQQNPELVAYAKGISADPRWGLLIQTLKNEHPMNYPDMRAGLPPADDSKTLGRIQGYNSCLFNLEALTQYRKPVEEPQAVFEPETTKPSKE